MQKAKTRTNRRKRI